MVSAKPEFRDGQSADRVTDGWTTDTCTMTVVLLTKSSLAKNKKNKEIEKNAKRSGDMPDSHLPTKFGVHPLNGL